MLACLPRAASNSASDIHVGDVVEESDGDLMGDEVNIAARLESIARPGAVCLSEDAHRQVKGRLDLAVDDLGPIQLKNIAEPIRVYSLQVGNVAIAKPAPEAAPSERKSRSGLLPLIAGIVALGVILGGVWFFLAGNRTAPVAATTPPPPRPRISRLLCCHSRISPAIRRKTISPTASRRT